jgi:ribosomal protein S18 acetylase RimI-like enzyme
MVTNPASDGMMRTDGRASVGQPRFSAGWTQIWTGGFLGCSCGAAREYRWPYVNIAGVSTVRLATTADEPFLWAMLTHAASMESHGPEAVAAAQGDRYLSTYVAGWGRPGDLGVVAEDAAGQPLGAAWIRVVGDAAHRMKMGTGELPELAIAVRPEHRGQGLGAALLERLVAAAGGRYPAMVLSVRRDSPAIRLYERCGFTVEREIQNRVGSASVVMMRALDG